MSTLLTSLTRQSAGGGDLTPYPITGYTGGSVAAFPSSSSGIFCKFRVNKPRTVNGIRVLNGIHSGNIKVALYSSDGTTATQIAISASTASTGDSVLQDVSFIAAVTIVPFVDYFAMLAADNGTVTFYRISYAAATYPAALGLTFTLAAQFTTPTTPITIANFINPAGGYTPVMALV